jgi:hypothetical protein
MLCKLIKSKNFNLSFIFLSLLIHFWTIVNYTFYSLRLLLLTVLIPFGAELYWIINNRNEKETGPQFDFIASIFLTITAIYIIINFSVAIRSIKYVYYYFTAWFLLYATLSLLGLFGYSKNTIKEFEDLSYFEYYNHAILEDSGWVITYTFLIGWWFTFLVLRTFKVFKNSAK